MKKILLCLIVIGLCFSAAGSASGGLSPSVSAATSIAQDQQKLADMQKKLEGIRGNKKNLQDDILKNQNRQQALLAEKQLLEQEYTLLVEEEKAISEIIAEYGNIIIKTKAQAEEKQTELEEQLGDFGAVLVDLYKYGDDTALEVFLRSDSYSSYVAYTECMNHMLKNCGAMVDRINKIIDEIETKKSDYEDAKLKLEGYNAEKAEAIKQKDAKMAETEAKRLQYKKEEEEGKLLAENYKKQEEDMAKDILSLQNTIKDKLKATYDGQFSWPYSSNTVFKITSDYGWRDRNGGEYHNGIDLAAARGTPIKAADAGTVSFAGWRGNFGNVVFLEHGGGITTVYAHCDSLLVSTGAKVIKDQVIARVGSTGDSTGFHLHFAVLKNGEYVNPRSWLPSYYLNKA